MTIIGQRHKIVQQDIPVTNGTIPDITNIPDGIKVTSNSIKDCNDNMENTVQSSAKSFNGNNKMTCPMIIDILNDTI